MNRRDARREACAVAARLLWQALEEAESNVFDPAWSDKDIERFEDEAKGLVYELRRRAGTPRGERPEGDR
ncbi:hypothetical protein BBK82_03605 [Lentzea guizhouensis]|uniref:Uncharacterized protein n=1 Tax=Lentzea guizhouensis TaxID=1586287 RepID=A0A1B2HC67_9PSEU|nr:hypothetical protein [Lentzea guizhouensis]ANZ35302.1 hypothetical protein BBK82_03605 [Lentzea guizhouensis]